jgi:hypothetical protein
MGANAIRRPWSVAPWPGTREEHRGGTGTARAASGSAYGLLSHHFASETARRSPLRARQTCLKCQAGAISQEGSRPVAEVGNLSSASVLRVMEMTRAQCLPPTASYGVMIRLGSGVSVELTCCGGACSAVRFSLFRFQARIPTLPA